MADWHKLEAEDGTIVPVLLYKPEHTVKAVFLVLPALGVKAKFYGRLAEGLSRKGVVTLLMEQRGHGKSPYRARRGQHVGYLDYLQTDIPLAIDWLKGKFPNTPLFVGGHSLGAHFSNFMAVEKPDDIAGLIHIACVFPYHGFYSKKAALQIKFLCAVLPLLTTLVGYYPGALLGFGSKEYSQVMLDWRKWAQTGCYDFGPVHDIEQRMAEFRGPLLSISIEGDTLASEKALVKPNRVMAGTNVSHVHLTEKEQGDYIGHFNWARKPDGIVKTISDWVSWTV